MAFPTTTHQPSPLSPSTEHILLRTSPSFPPRPPSLPPLPPRIRPQLHGLRRCPGQLSPLAHRAGSAWAWWLPDCAPTVEGFHLSADGSSVASHGFRPPSARATGKTRGDRGSKEEPPADG